ncbi:hypothetical protein PTTG_03199 [Puccinia triticina 1-1 BBBD Race 1]|uniref:Uncharacterized protein n=2 Tax=Puccinia triticina TaxID=208348 RepID=A0A0C4EQY8_PUCT1|nr:uncharacterized protein PtA15_15A480 [Puccinia triticina]OAV97984.1 hypothetical protein PTTG_03199 [Puccinia triticina 1-1 BBBD Race 1]WAQ92084.1 hypothetical protein PtA15_15A480 [Puccinia triticina]WAR62907.1 hypothetical protein PtB15_15B495 [Puccinia triticina]
MPAQHEQFSLSFLVRAVAGLASHKLPTQAQLSKIITAILDSPLFDAGRDSQTSGADHQQPALLSSIAEFLVVFKNLTDTKNRDSQAQRLLSALVVDSHQPQLRLPTLPPSLSNPSSSSPTIFLKKLLLSSVEIPHDVNAIVQESLDLLTELFNPSKRKMTKEDDQTVDRIVSKLIKLIVHLRRSIGGLLREEIESFRVTLAEDFEGFKVNDEFREIIGLVGQCVDGFCAGEDHAPSYWHSLTAPWNQLIELFTEHKDELLAPLKKVQVVIVQMFDDSDDQLYSPRLYESLAVAVKEFQEASRLIGQPMGEILQALERIRLRIVVEDPSWPEAYQAFQRVSTELLCSTTANSKDLARHVTGGVAKATFNTLLEYIVPRLLLLINEIPSPRIEYVSPTIDAVFDPASFTSTSGFLPSSMISTTVHRLEVSQRSSEDQPGRIPGPNTLSVRPNTYQKISIVGLRVLSKNVGFYFHKKVDQDKNIVAQKLDFTNIEDEGKVDIFLGMGDQDGLSLDLELDWNYHRHLDCSSEVPRRARHAPSLQNPDGLFLIKSFKVDLKGFGVFPHDTSHPVLNWILKPGLEPYIHGKITETLQEYLLDQLTRLNNLLGKMRIRWEEVADSGRGTTWEKLWEVIKVIASGSEEAEEEDQPESTSRIDGSGFELEAEDGSYTIRIGIGQKMLPGKGLGGPGGFKERLAIIADDAGAAIDRRVTEIADGIKQATLDGERPGWQSDVFDL